MGLEKNGIRKKSFLGVLVFGNLYCPSINSTQFNVEHENTCSFHYHIGSSSFPTFRDLNVLKCNCAKKKIIIFCIKFITYIKKFKFLRRIAIKISFSFYFFTIPSQRNSMETLYPKKKSCNIFSTRNFC